MKRAYLICSLEASGDVIGFMLWGKLNHENDKSLAL